MNEPQQVASPVESNESSGRGMSLGRILGDVRAYVTYAPTWKALAWADIRSKYRRTALGPWWITCTHGCLAVMMALVAGNFLGAEMSLYLPHFMVSVTIWNFISFSMNESTHTLIYAGGMIKATNMPIATYIMRLVQRNFIIFLHSVVIIPLIWLFFSWSIGPSFLLVVPGLALVYAFVGALTTMISIICVRYRDVPPLVAALVQLLFFVSPIVWMPEQVRGGYLAIVLNPISYVIAVVRDPVLGKPFDPLMWGGACVVVAVSVALAALVYSRYRGRVVFWV